MLSQVIQNCIVDFVRVALEKHRISGHSGDLCRCLALCNLTVLKSVTLRVLWKHSTSIWLACRLKVEHLENFLKLLELKSCWRGTWISHLRVHISLLIITLWLINLLL